MMTQKELAERLKLSPSAVSAALNNRGNIPEATRRRVQEAARKLGYQPNAASRLMAYKRHQHKTRNINVSVLLLSSFRSGYQPFRPGIRSQAEALGLHLDELYIEEDCSSKRLEGILLSRGTQGLLLPKFPPTLKLDLNWNAFSVVALGHYPEHFHRVIQNLHQIVTECVLRAHAAGYKRMGLVQREKNLEQVNYLSLGGYLSAMNRIGETALPAFEYAGDTTAMLRWMEKYNVDCLISGIGLKYLFENEALKRAILSAGFFALNTHSSPPGTIGMYQDFAAQGSHAVSVLFSMLARGERGMAKISRVTMIEGLWDDGSGVK